MYNDKSVVKHQTYKQTLTGDIKHGYTLIGDVTHRQTIRGDKTNVEIHV